MANKIITINVPESYLDAIEVLTDLKQYPSRSEFVRVAVRDLLQMDLMFFQDIKKEQFTELMVSKKK